jgi:signal transduction histidine kinase
MLLGSLRGRLIGSMTILLCGGLALVSGLHALEQDGHDPGARLGRSVGRFLVGDGLPEPWQDLAVLLPFSLVMLALIGAVTGWSLRPLLRASQEAGSAGPHDPAARIGTANLPSELSPLVEAVNAALDRLTAAYETERRFTADAAHELRTPLATLSLRLQRTQHDGAPIEWQAVEADLAVMRRLIEGLLDLARKEAAGRSATMLNLSRTIREAAAGIEPLVQQAGRELLVELPDALWMAGNPDDLRDMVRNLAQNALVHGRGRIRIRLGQEAGPGANAVLDVADEGDGVDAADREAVFERFRKGSPTSMGSGLGLAIVRAVASAHGGSVGFAGQSGCTLRVVLPLAGQEAG